MSQDCVTDYRKFVREHAKIMRGFFSFFLLIQIAIKSFCL